MSAGEIGKGEGATKRFDVSELVERLSSLRGRFDDFRGRL